MGVSREPSLQDILKAGHPYFLSCFHFPSFPALFSFFLLPHSHLPPLQLLDRSSSLFSKPGATIVHSEGETGTYSHVFRHGSKADIDGRTQSQRMERRELTNKNLLQKMGERESSPKGNPKGEQWDMTCSSKHILDSSGVVYK